MKWWICLAKYRLQAHLPSKSKHSGTLKDFKGLHRKARIERRNRRFRERKTCYGMPPKKVSKAVTKQAAKPPPDGASLERELEQEHRTRATLLFKVISIPKCPLLVD